MHQQILNKPVQAILCAEDNVIQELLRCAHRRSSTAAILRPSGPRDWHLVRARLRIRLIRILKIDFVDVDLKYFAHQQIDFFR